MVLGCNHLVPVLLALVSSSCFCSVCGSAAMASDCCRLASSSELLSHFKREALESSYFLYLSTTSLRLLPSWLHWNKRMKWYFVQNTIRKMQVNAQVQHISTTKGNNFRIENYHFLWHWQFHSSSKESVICEGTRSHQVADICHYNHW